MKKVILIASILATSIISANNTTPKKDNFKGKKETTLKSKKTKLVKEVTCGSVDVGCIQASTCQDWTMDQWYHWAQLIRENYCN